jgi:transposase
VARASAPQHLVLRAKIVLAAWRRDPNAKIARDLRVGVDTVRTWRRRFRREGIPGLFDRPRTGRPPVYGIAAQLLIVATVTQQRPEIDAQWTHRGIAEHLHTQVGISASQIGRILACLDVKPHRVRGPLQPRAGIGPAQHGDLVPQYQQLDVLGRGGPAEQNQPVTESDEDQVQQS